MRRSIYIMLAVALVLGGGCSRSKKDKALLRHMEEGGPMKEAFDVRFIFSEDAVKQAQLDAPHAIETKEDDQEVRLFDRGLHLVFYTPEGEKESDLTADQGKFKNEFNDAEVWGNVVMINVKGDQLNTERLFWNKKENKIYSNEFVKIRTEKEIIYGDSMRANTDFTDYKIFNIRGSIDLTEEEEL